MERKVPFHKISPCGKTSEMKKKGTKGRENGQKIEMTKRKGCKRREREERKRPTARERLGWFVPRQEASGIPSFSSHRPPPSSPPAVSLCVSVRSAAAITAVRPLTDCSGFRTKPHRRKRPYAKATSSFLRRGIRMSPSKSNKLATALAEVLAETPRWTVVHFMQTPAVMLHLTPH